jgi:hypothetical protein
MKPLALFFWLSLAGASQLTPALYGMLITHESLSDGKYLTHAPLARWFYNCFKVAVHHATYHFRISTYHFRI